jgi:hypothetical protein
MEAKKYKKMYYINVPSVLKVAKMATLVAFILGGISVIITSSLEWIPAITLLDSSFWTITFFAYLGDTPCMIYENKRLKFRDFIVYKSISYESIRSVCISNALIYRRGYDNLARKVQYTEKGLVKSTNIPGAWVTLVSTDNVEGRLYPFMTGGNVKAKFTSSFLYDFQYRKNVFLELLRRYKGKIYILEDVYERFSDQMEYIFAKKEVNSNRIVIIPKNKEYRQ